VLAMALVLASRLSFKSLELIRDRLGRHGARVLIYGADDGGELTLRELRNHGDLGLRPVCFVDDDARRHGAEIHGVPIVAGFDGLAWAVAHYRIDKIVIGTRKLAPEAVDIIGALAQQLGLEVAEVNFNVSWIAASGPALESQSHEAAEASVATGGNGGGGGGRQRARRRGGSPGGGMSQSVPSSIGWYACRTRPRAEKQVGRLLNL